MQGTKKRKDEDISSFQLNKALVRLKALVICLQLMDNQYIINQKFSNLISNM